GQTLLGSRGRGGRQIDVGQLVVRVDRRRALTVRLVDGDVRQVAENLGAAIGRAARREQLRALLDERGGDVSGLEVRVIENRLQERDVSGDTANAEFRDRP